MDKFRLRIKAKFYRFGRNANRPGISGVEKIMSVFLKLKKSWKVGITESYISEKTKLSRKGNEVISLS